LPSRPSINLRRRVFWVFLLTALAIMTLAGRVAWIQFARGEELRRRALDVRLRDVPVEPRRGTITDRRGRELAISVTVDSVYAIPAEISDPAATARAVAGVLGMDPAGLEERLSQPASFTWVKRKIDAAASRTLREMALPGIEFTQESRRFYPKDTLACHVLGFAGIDSQGLEGIEFFYDDRLRGVPGQIVVEFDARGRELPQTTHRYLPPEDGLNLVLTLDEVIQYIAERELDAMMAESQAKRGIVLVMDPAGGEILALACRPGYNPNQWNAFDSDLWRNVAISDTFCPGSTFKPLTAAAAVEEGAVDWGSSFYCRGAVQVPGAVISCVRAHGSQSLLEIIKNSCNVGFVQTGLELGVDHFYDYMEAFGLQAKTGIDLPGEGIGLMPAREAAKPVDLAVMAFGQTLTVTPLRLLVALSAIANDGVMMRPHVAHEFRDADGNVVERIEPEPVRRVVSPETARELAEALVAVVEEGTGQRAQVPGYRVGGKTGTAQKVIEGRVVHGQYVSAFFGFAPAERPRLAVLVMFDEPQGAYYGGVIAAPMVGAVLADALRYLEVPPSGREEGVGGEPLDGAPVPVPSVVNLPVGEAQAVVEAAGFRWRATGEGDTVVAQTPPPGVDHGSGSEVLAELGPAGEGAAAAAGVEVTVPDIGGMTLRPAAETLARVGLRLLAEGSGVAVGQEPAPGEVVAAGSVVRVTFSPPEGSQ